MLLLLAADMMKRLGGVLSFLGGSGGGYAGTSLLRQPESDTHTSCFEPSKKDATSGSMSSEEVNPELAAVERRFEVMRFAAMGVGMIGLCANAFGGIVLFAPEEIILEAPGTAAITPVAMAFIPTSGTNFTFDAFDVLVGSYTVPISGFTFDLNIINNFPNRAIAEPAGFGIYSNEIYASASRSTDPTFGQFTVSTFNLDLSSLPLGDHLVQVNPDIDGALSALFNRGVSDPLAGELAILVVPEPATLSMFAVGVMAAAIRFGRHRTAYAGQASNRPLLTRIRD